MSSSAGSGKIAVQHFRSPQTVIARFVARRNIRSAALWALVFGVYVASKAIGFVDTYPTAAGRQKVAEAYSNNIGTEILLGPLKHTASIGSVVAWNVLGIMVIIGSIWAMLLAAKTFRGEEDNGRLELLLTGQTTARRAAANMLAGLAACLGILYVIMAIAFSLVGRANSVDFSVQAAFFLALSVVAGVALFMTAGALASQLLPTRGRAAGAAAAFLGLSFVLRAVGDVTSAHWVLNLTPLGWVEKLQPLFDTRALWLLPLFGLTAVLAGLTVFLAGRRDFGEALLADKDTSPPRTALLGSPFTAAIRLTRAASLNWLIAIFLSATLYGLLTKSTAQAFGQSSKAEKVLNHLAHQTQVASVAAFLGLVFFLQMVVIMAYAASSLAAIRRDEADGYLDNFLVRPVSRFRWLSGRVCLTVIVIILAGCLTGLGAWIGAASQHSGVSFHTLLAAGINALVPAIVTVGFGVFALGLRPRLTALAAYGVLSWSFLISMLSSGLNLNHWIMDTSILNHVVFAPAANPRWGTNAILVVIALALCTLGAFIFNRRDLAAE